ncbi:MAG: gamma-glutamylcyclotransferase family protein [Planctomycetaceae bacterium]
MQEELLFVYGSLQPGYRFPTQARAIKADRVHGLLYDLGEYPAAVQIDQVEDWFAGHLIAIPSELFQQLDDYEGVDEGLYRRIRTVTESGESTWIYEFIRSLPSTAVGPITAWPSED